MTAAVERMSVRIESACGCLVLVLQSGGLTGRGEAAGADLDVLRRELLDGRPRHPAARAAWETARLDLAGRAAGVPVAALLGGARRSRVRCAWHVAARSPAAVAREVESGVTAGFRTFELRAEAGGGDFDLERLGAARWAAGPGVVLRLDLGTAPPGAGRARLRHSLDAFHAVLVEGAIEPARAGGPAAACELAGAAAGPVLVRATPATSVGLAAVLHAACAMDADLLDCGIWLPAPLRGPWLDLPAGPGLGTDLYRLDR